MAIPPVGLSSLLGGCLIGHSRHLARSLLCFAPAHKPGRGEHPALQTGGVAGGTSSRGGLPASPAGLRVERREDGSRGPLSTAAGLQVADRALTLQFCGAIVLIFFLELAVAVLAFLFQDWVRDRFREFFESNIRSYRDDIDLQNLIDSLQKANQCCGAYGPEDWDLNVYFNCSGASYSREKCGVPFSCCVPDPAQKVVNTQCGYDVRTQLKGKWEESIFTKGCIPALEGWLPRNIYIVAGVFIAISLLQIFGIFLARTLISDIEAVKAGHHF
uniref:Tetraspanin 14 n=1 Tax=Equus caballus TaxID=9796 RepID=A0A3Q2H4Y0_HORSE